jgi:hypothetical protein
MQRTPSDVNIKARWVAPMTGEGELLEAHTLVIRDGRILDVLPHREAAERYSPRVELERPAHLAMPGLVNARTRLAPLPGDSPAQGFQADGALLCVANMLRAGITCFCDTGYFPRDVAATAAAQGLRAVIGLPVAEHSSAWAHSPAEYLSTRITRRFPPDSRRSTRARWPTRRSSASGYWPRSSTRAFLSRCRSRSRTWKTRFACAANVRSSAFKLSGC